MKRWVQALGKCDKCRTQIVWATSAAGTRTPLDPEPDATAGNLLLDLATMRFVKLGVMMIARAIERGDALYSNHLVTCPVRKEERNAA
jgi:hypothetical protein